MPHRSIKLTQATPIRASTVQRVGCPQRAGVLRGHPTGRDLAGYAGEPSGRVGPGELRAEVQFELAALLHAAGEQVGHPCSATG